ncbi:MAG: DUF2062 domain-containing protein [Natronomonas sp.]
MIRTRLGAYRDRIREELRKTFLEEHTSREIAGSFSVGAFITMLPTLGTGLLVFVVIAFVFDRVSKLALFASVVVFNPLVKWGVYVASFALGVLLLGPIEGGEIGDISFSAGPEIVLRLLVGNLILAVLAMVVSYVAVYRLAIAYETTEVGEIVEETVEEVVDTVVDK